MCEQMETDWNRRGDDAARLRMRDWLDTQARVTAFWLEPDDRVRPRRSGAGCGRAHEEP